MDVVLSDVSPHRERRRETASDRRAGFSLVEVLIAAALLLFITLGVLPLFTRSMVDNNSGAESTQVANMARSRLEQFYQLPFNSTEMTITGGTENVFTDYYSLNERVWKVGTPPNDGSDLVGWTRIATVRQYSVNALDDEILDPGEALPAGTDPSRIHFKELEIVVRGLRQSTVLGPSKQITLRGLKFK
jgi:type II secretory pathway pseudopilin PulG